ncbi:sec-independent protein translocase protein TatA [Pseudonocardia sediminis]|uniref:Sec-independent protein translocase protein TatA n=1 Tax=Pseudonocardia sediminis TaxID=1397368 RepID=A0A4Q7V2E1_PSEST|nr:sec-independent protein translocase protein TatA [Pseudonocardia sediminis]
MGAMSPTHWLIVLAVLLLLFGAKKLPDLARSVGQSTRVLKGEMRGLKEDEEAAKPAVAAPAPVEQSTPVEQRGAVRNDAA